MKTLLATLSLLFALSAQSKSVAPYKHVLLIGIDGLGSHNLYPSQESGVRDPKTPNIDFLKNNGAWSLDAQIDERNWSGPNWMGILSGYNSNQHGIHSNDCRQANENYPTIFKHLREALPDSELGVIFNWKSIGCYPAEGTLNKKSSYLVTPTGASKAIRYLKKKRPHFLFFYIGSPDSAGHGAGSSSLHYKWTLERADRQIGRILKALKKTGLDKETLVILTSDHGHDQGSKNHSSAKYPVPFFVYGKGVVKGEIKEKVQNNMVAPLIYFALTKKILRQKELEFSEFKFLFNN